MHSKSSYSVYSWWHLTWYEYSIYFLKEASPSCTASDDVDDPSGIRQGSFSSTAQRHAVKHGNQNDRLIALDDLTEAQQALQSLAWTLMSHYKGNTDMMQNVAGIVDDLEQAGQDMYGLGFRQADKSGGLTFVWRSTALVEALRNGDWVSLHRHRALIPTLADDSIIFYSSPNLCLSLFYKFEGVIYAREASLAFKVFKHVQQLCVRLGNV